MSDLAGPHGTEIIAALKEAKIEYVCTLPDIWTSHGLLWPLSKDPDLKLIRLCKEDEGVSICTGLAYTRRRAVLLMQYTGFLDSVNAVRAIAVNYEVPVCMVIGLLGKEPGVPAAESKRYDTRITKGILDVMGVDNFTIEGSGDVGLLPPAIERAYENSRPVAALLGREIRV
jgi:sulfopyruvate decarboxylase TPP-binding subunit